jgi:deazaflavin-dependent oxidoreductase (nitroreductase family)
MYELVRALSRVTRPLAGRRFFPLWALLHHRGRRTGRVYVVPVGVRAVGDTFTIALPVGERTQWMHNVLAAGDCTIRWKGRDYLATEPTVVGVAEAAPAFNRVLRGMMRVSRVRTCLRLRRNEAASIRHAGR